MRKNTDGSFVIHSLAKKTEDQLRSLEESSNWDMSQPDKTIIFAKAGQFHAQDRRIAGFMP
jgi:hypothetical protein